MILATLWLSSAALACEDVHALPDSVQVAWISPVGERVTGSAWLEVVRVSDLRRWVNDHDRDAIRALQALGMVNGKARGAAADRDYMITIFDVNSEWLCRPIEGATPGEEIGGVPACEDGQQGPAGWSTRRGFTGCGYTLDTAASTRGLDVYRIRWEDASAWGFCVLPWERFLDGA